jgi:hypothetical protein
MIGSTDDTGKPTHLTPDSTRPKIARKTWAAPVVIVESTSNAGAKGFTYGDYTSYGAPYGS